MAFAIKTEVRDLRAKTFVFIAQKTMYGGKHIANGNHKRPMKAELSDH
jgi:hypothetical protein